jgi:glycosyltransferase involved in cell wall biosynthesis
MKILWIVNTIFPAPSIALKKDTPLTGGWMYGLAEEISKQDNVQLAVATIYGGNQLLNMTIDSIVYYLLPCKTNIKYDKNLENLWSEVYNEFTPDLVHIHGTEFAHGLACMRILPNLKYVVSIQGLVGIYSRYYYSGLSFWDIVKNISFRDIVRFDSIFHQKNKFAQRSENELEYLQRTNHVIGRTHWDYVHSNVRKNSIKYHFCNESLRNTFYSAKKWSLDNCNKHCLFLSQAGYPIKGLHQVIKALVILKVVFPDLKIKVGGGNITKNDSFSDKMKMSGYGKYVRKLLKKHNLENDVVFLGALSEEQMVIEYNKAHLFICPSSIENSPNSLGEAQLLGTPIIASYVGGVPDMVKDGETGLLYRFEEVEMLAENIRRVFRDDNLTRSLSVNGIKAAEKRHNRDDNMERTIEIYNEILKN